MTGATSTTLADLEGGGDSQISFSVTHGWSAFGGTDHGWQDAELGRGAWTLSDAVSGSVGPQGAATNVSSLRGGALAIARAFSRWRTGLRLVTTINCTTSSRLGSGMRRLWKPNCLSKPTGSSAAAMPCW